MNLTEKTNFGKLKLGFFNRKSTQNGFKPLKGPGSSRTAVNSRKNSTPSSNLNWGRSRQSISSSCVHSEASICNEDTRIVLALSEGRGEARCEVGIAVINVSQPHLILCQISDTQSYDNTLRKINIFNPNQILVPMTFVGSANQSRLIEKVKEQFPQITQIPVRRNTYNKTNGMEFIQELCVPSLNSVFLILQYRYYALTAASALFRYLQNNLNIFYATGSIKIEYQESEGYAVIDVSTADRLELVSSTKPLQASKYSTLFGVLNNCYTRIGERALRTILLQPPFATSLILERQECVTALIKHVEKLQSIQVILQKLGNVDQLLTLPTIVIDDSPTCSNRQLNYILYLNGLVDLIITLNDVISTFDQSLFKNISIMLRNQDFLNIKDAVRTLINENAYAAKSQNGLFQRCFAIKPGINGLLDLVRKIYSERVDDMREYVKTLGEKYNLPLTLGNNITKGYHIVFSLNKHQRLTFKKSDIPKEFIQVCRLAGSFTMKTMELINFQTRIDDIVADILKISNVMIFKTLTSFKKHIGLFYRLCEDIAIIDVLQSLAEVSLRNNYVKPTFSDFTEVKESQHPMLHMLVHENPVPNSISSSQNFNVHIITGPNGSGKSIYIRQVMLLQIMAQIGGYVPASSAVFRPADRLFARVYLEDNMECGASSFVLEIKEVLYILSHITDYSLVIIDELARSTSLEEGAALAMAICECFVNSSSFVYLTSHFSLVTKLGDLYLNVKNWFMDTHASGDTPQSMKLSFKHTIKNGVTNLKRYGIYMVKNIWPADLLDDVYSLLEEDNKTKKELKTLQLSKESRLKYNIEADLKKFNAKGKLNPSKVNEVINYYQTKFENSSLGVDMLNFKIGESKDECFFDDTVPDDALSEAVDQVEYSLSSQADSNYEKLNAFIGDNSENINLLNPDIQIHEFSRTNEDGMIFVDDSLNQRPGNRNIKILSNILLNADNNLEENNVNCSNEFEQCSNLRSCSQEIYQNSQDFEEVNEINRSLLTEMQNIDRKNFEEFNSGSVYKGTLMEPNFLYSIENDYKEEQNTSMPTISTDQFNCFPKPGKQDSDFCFLKPSEPPLKKRFVFKNQYPSSNKENLNETDQITFSLDLLRNPNKTSTPTISRNRYSFEVQETSFPNCSETEMNSLKFTSENIFSQENSQHSLNQLISPSVSEPRPYIFLGEDTFKEEDKNKPRFFIRKNNENVETSCILEDNYQKYGSFLINEDEHIFPKVNIVQGPNNKSLSFGEEDKLSSIPKKPKPKNINEKDINFEQFLIEETKLFLSHSRDIFEGDIDELEITIENNESDKKSHNEISDNVIRMLEDEKISSKQKKLSGSIDEIKIQDTQFDMDNKIDIESENSPLEPKDLSQIRESKKEKDINSFTTSNHFNPNHIVDEQNLKRNFQLHNLFEESDLESYLNNDLTISKVPKNSKKIVNSSSTPENKNCNILHSPKTMVEHTEIKTVSTSLSEASRKRNLDNSISTSKTTDNQDKEEMDIIEKSSGIPHEVNNFNELKTPTKPSNYVEKKMNLSIPSEMLLRANNEKTVSTNLSEASKKRNLDTSTTDKTSDNQDDEIMEESKKKSDISHEENGVNELKTPPKPSNYYSKTINEQAPSERLSDVSNDSDTHSSRGKAVTSISDASRRRNLDNPSSSTSSDYQGTYIECEEKFSDGSSCDKKLKDLIIPKQNKKCNQAIPSSNILNNSDNPQKIEDRKGNLLQGGSNVSSSNYETAEEENLSAICKWRNLDKYASKDTCKSNKIEKKHETKTENISEKYTSVSKCSTETLSGISSIKFDSPSTNKGMNRDCNTTTKNANEETEKDISVESCHIDINDSFISSNEASFSLSKQSKKRKYLGYRRRPQVLSKKSKKEEFKKSRDSVKPFKLTKYQIQEEFDKQDQIILEENLDVETYNKYLIQRMNRPSVKQIQNMEHIVTFRKTRDGTVVLPPPLEKTYKTRKRMDRKIFESSKMIDVSIFSDQNASKMSAFLASNERNYSQFKFEPELKCGDGYEDDSSPRCMNFFSQFVQKKKIKIFNRSRSFGDFKFQDYTNINHNNSFKMQVSIPSQQSDSSSIFLPNGFFKENKKDIDNICAKYLLGSQPGLCRTNTSPM